jgi:glycosyltransferase involved in cell wall biosynthesis
MSVTFFVPCLNEEISIKKTILEILSAIKETDLNDFEILVFDDASTDQTIKRVQESIFENNLKENHNIRIIKNKITKGLGFNYVEGAFQSRKKYYIMICGDHSEKKENIVKILSLREKADIILTNFVDNDSRNFMRKTFSKFFTFFINFITGNNIKYYNGNVLHQAANIRRWSPKSSGFGYQAELLVNLLFMKKSYIEVSIQNVDRKVGFSRGYTFLNFLSVCHSILQIFFRSLRFKIWGI